MSIQIETKEDLQLVKYFTLYPILMDMVARDLVGIQSQHNKIIYSHFAYYLQDVEMYIFAELERIRRFMRNRGIKVLTTTTNAKGLEVEYLVRGYRHKFYMLRSLVKADIKTLLMHIRREVSTVGQET